MQVIATLAELDGKLRELDVMASISDQELRRGFQGFRMDFPIAHAADPESAPYADAQFELYRTIAGRDYSNGNEKSTFDAQQLAARPFPYMNGSASITGDQLMAIGWIIRTMGLPTGGSVLELGPGWGNTTLAMAQNGYAVTAIDIEPNFVELIRERARRLPVDIEVRQGDFLDAAALGRRFDRVLFFECFHHCADHLRLMDMLDDIVAPGGAVLFAGEPISDNFPMPWGLRLDGESLWAIRRNGWLELGFSESYFIRALMRRGWLVTKHVLDACPFGTIHVAHRVADGRYTPGTFELAPDEDATWAPRETDPGLAWRYTSEQSRMTVQRLKAGGTIALQLANTAPFTIAGEVRHGCSSQAFSLAAGEEFVLSLPADAAADLVEISSGVWKPSAVYATSDERIVGIGVRAITAVP